MAGAERCAGDLAAEPRECPKVPMGSPFGGERGLFLSNGHRVLLESRVVCLFVLLSQDNEVI